jgi:hypothetical protein
VLALAVAAKMHCAVIGGRAAARMVFFCAVSAHLWLPARHCNMAIALALVALGHVALTVKSFVILKLMVMQQAFLYESVRLF